MKTQNQFTLSSLCMLVFSSLLTSSVAQDISTESTVVNAKEGDSSILTCKVPNLSSQTVSWTFVTHNRPIFKGRELLAHDRSKYSILIPLDNPSYFNLMLMDVAKSDSGFYRCSIDGTDKSVTIHLNIMGKQQIPFNLPPLNQTECCKDAGVKTSCLPVCAPEGLNTTDVTVDDCDDPNSASLIGLIKCLTANSNHDNCCLFQGLDPMCLPFCHNEIPDDLTTAHEYTCLADASLNIFIKCFTVGFASLPDVPRDVTVLPSTTNQASSLVVTWKPPRRNPDKVTGYKIMYRRDDKIAYYSFVVSDPTANKYQLTGPNIIANMGYFVHVAALADQGVSMGSVDISVFIPDESLSEKQSQHISECCAHRYVSTACNSLLCRSRTWSHFNYDALEECFPKLNEIFTCLAGERNHSSCCETFGVSSICQPLCSGQPPPINEDLIICTHELGTIEACVQQGYEKLPGPPTNLQLRDVTSISATVTFDEPNNSTSVQQYIVELHKGLDEERTFKPYSTLSPQSLAVFLKDLSPDTHYGIRIITEAMVDSKVFGSLPSEAVYFLTYPASFGQSTSPPVVNVPHDIKACCEAKGMPKKCSDGCKYVSNITSYYGPILDVCASHIGSVLSCAADGRDHTSCCSEFGVKDQDCLKLCKITTTGGIPASIGFKCITATPIAINCFMEGILHLPRHPDVVVRSVSWNSISLEWIQPPTSGLIDIYIIDYGIKTDPNRIQKEVNNTHYILNDLEPGSDYTLTVSSQNENGTSAPSPVITVYTLRESTKIPDFNTSVETATQLWTNISHCCVNSGIPSECVDLCLNKQLQSPNASCIQHSHKMLACYADGQDHSLCCSRNPQLPEACYSLCKGQAKDLTPQIASCMSYGNRAAILSCFLENSALIPGSPQSLAVKMKSPNKVQLVWLKPDGFCSDDCTGVIMYWKFDPDNPEVKDVKMIKNAESPNEIDNLDTESFYTFAVRAENPYGIGPPSNLVQLFLSGYRRDVKVTLKNDKDFVERGQDATLQCAASDFNPDDPYTLKWFFNNGREIIPEGSNSNILVIKNVDPLKDEGNYWCIVTDSTETNSDGIFLPIQYAPIGAEVRDGTVSPGKGEQAILACWFNGYPDSEVDQWMKDGAPVRKDTTKYSMQRQIRYHTGITSYRLKIANIVEADYGKYSISVSNKFGRSGCTVKLQDPDDIIDIKPAEKVFNGTECCAKKGVTELCQYLCRLDIDIAEVMKNSSYITCLAFFEESISCGADGRDHTTCCKKNGVNPFCFPFCVGQTPGSIITDQEELLQCVGESSQIFQCLHTGHNLVPFAPRNVIISWWASGQTIMVRWSKPLHNFDKIDHYFVHYKSGNSSEKIHMVNDQIQEYEIKNVNKETDYQVYITARNKWGNSLNSEVVTLKAIALPAPSHFHIEIDVDLVGATLKWEDSPASSPSFDSYNVYYKKSNDGRFIRKSGITQPTYHLTGLAAKTEYVAYVTTQSKRGYESAPSLHERFTTGEKPVSNPQSGSDDDDDKIAIGIGIVVAIFAVAAIVFLVIYLMKSRRMHKLNNDTVTFENPGYGNPGSVKIQGMHSDEQFGYGRLDEERSFNNPRETANSSEEASGAFNNLTYAGQEDADPTVATLPVNSDA